ncbi:MAG: hypothetical protein ACLU78_11605 [Clostridium sp.]
MSIKPILFNTEMVRAILDGIKTCTRRVVRYKYSNTEMKIKKDKYGARLIEIQKDENSDGSTYQKLLPFVEKEAQYQPGDILYVRETFAWCPCWDCGLDTTPDGCKNPVIYDFKKKEHGCYMYRASCEDNEYPSDDTWHPSIHMPKEAARIFLKVTNVRVERLQEITDDGCIAEGVYPSPCRKCNATFGCDTCPDEGYHETDGFSELWNSTIKKSDLDRYGWDANPYVWVVEFERCEKPPECIFKGYDKAPDDGSEKCLGYMYDNSDTLIPMCEKCSCQESYESEEED